MEVGKLASLTTEGRNENTLRIDRLDTEGIISLINEEDKRVAIAKVLEENGGYIQKAIDSIKDN